MAVVTASAIGIGTSLYQTGSAIAEGNKAQDAIDAFKPQERRNPYKDLALDTTSADQQTAANISNVASSIEAVQRTGGRGVAAAVPRLTESSLILQDRISADLTNQAQRRDELIARGEDKIQDLQDQREREILAGLGQQLNVSRQDVVSGVQGIVSGGLALDSAIKSKKDGDKDDNEVIGSTIPFINNQSFSTTTGLETNKFNPTGLPNIPGINPLLQ